MYQFNTPKKPNFVDKDFYKENSIINLRRGLKLAFIVSIFSVMVLISFLINAFLKDFNTPDYYVHYVLSYLFLLCVMIIIIATYYIIKKYYKLTDVSVKILSFLPFVIILFWTVSTSFINPSLDNKVIFYMIGLLIFGTMPLLTPVVSISTIVLSFITYILIPVVFDLNNGEVNYLNPTIFSLSSIVASLFLYFQKEKDFYYHTNIIQKNKELYELNNKLHKKSITDSLTKYYNRYYLDSLSEKCNNNIVSNMIVGVLMIDIDNFKDYNDFYNHVEGDLALIKISETIKNVIAPYTDNIFRYGGEEFLIVFFGIPDVIIRVIAEKIRKSVYDLNIKNPGIDPASNITVSIGGTVTKSNEDRTFEKMIIDADNALYNVKKIGKNNTLVI